MRGKGGCRMGELPGFLEEKLKSQYGADGFEKILDVCKSTGIKRNFIYGYQTHPDNLMHITGTYSFAAISVKKFKIKSSSAI